MPPRSDSPSNRSPKAPKGVVVVQALHELDLLPLRMRHAFQVVEPPALAGVYPALGAMFNVKGRASYGGDIVVVQAYGNLNTAVAGARALDQGRSLSDTLEDMAQADTSFEFRQVGIMCRSGQSTVQ